MAVTLSFDLPDVLEYGSVSVNLRTLNDEQLERFGTYCSVYGFNKSLQDSVAGLKSKLKDEGVDAAEIARRATEGMMARIDAIINGTLGVRTRLTSEDKLRRDVTLEFFKAFLVRKGKKLPRAKKDATDAEKKALAELIAAKVAEYGAANVAKIDAEVARRVAAQKAEAESDDEFDLDLTGVSGVDSDDDGMEDDE